MNNQRLNKLISNYGISFHLFTLFILVTSSIFIYVQSRSIFTEQKNKDFKKLVKLYKLQNQKIIPGTKVYELMQDEDINYLELRNAAGIKLFSSGSLKEWSDKSLCHLSICHFNYKDSVSGETFFVDYNTSGAKSFLYITYLFLFLLFGLLNVLILNFQKNLNNKIYFPVKKIQSSVVELLKNGSSPQNMNSTIDIFELKTLNNSVLELYNKMKKSELELKGSENQLKNSNIILEKTVKQRTSLLEKKIDELESLQAQIISKEKLSSLGRFSMGVAHEIKNPIHLIENASNSIKKIITRELTLYMDDSSMGGKLDRYLSTVGDLKKMNSIVVNNCERIDAIVKSILDSRRDLKKSKNIASLKDLIINCFQEVSKYYKDKENFFCELQIDEFNDLGLNIPELDFQRVLLNIFDNSFYAMKMKAESDLNYIFPLVSVVAKNEKGHLNIEIIDNGIGIKENQISMIQEPFVTTKPPGSGSGLGLSLVNDILTSHGASISIESEYKKFTKVIISLKQ